MRLGFRERFWCADELVLGMMEKPTIRSYLSFLGDEEDMQEELDDLEEELQILFSRMHPRAAAYFSRAESN